MNKPIDFVITWVDPTDKKWLEARSRYKNDNEESAGIVRYRDWDLLRYWFRAVEKCAPWVHKVYFVTYGHYPDWLNTDNEKLVIVRHEDYMDQEFLPTFNSNAIELYFNKIESLSEQFVYFNDDMFICKEMSEKDFFVDGIPVDSLSWNALSAKTGASMIEHIVLNDMELLDKNFNKKDVQKRQLTKLLNPKNGSSALKSLLLLSWKGFTGIENPHVAQPYLKSTLQEVWDKEKDSMLDTAKNRFRTKEDYSLWVARYWNLMKNNYVLKSRKDELYYAIGDDNSWLKDQLKNNKYKLICLNDSDSLKDFEKTKEEMKNLFEELLPNKSSFEKTE